MRVTFANPTQWQDASLNKQQRAEIRAIFDRHARENCQDHEYLPVFQVLDTGRRCAILYKMEFEFECLPEKRRVLVYAVRYKPRAERKVVYAEQPQLAELGFVGDPDLRNFGLRTQ